MPCTTYHLPHVLYHILYHIRAPGGVRRIQGGMVPHLVCPNVQSADATATQPTYLEAPGSYNQAITVAISHLQKAP